MSERDKDTALKPCEYSYGACLRHDIFFGIIDSTAASKKAHGDGDELEEQIMTSVLDGEKRILKRRPPCSHCSADREARGI